MIKDITLGQFLPANSVIHKLDPRVKIVLTITLIVAVFVCGNFASLLLFAAFVITVMALTKIKISMYLRSIKALIPIIIFTSILNAIYVKTGDVLFHIWKLDVTTGGVERAVFMSARILLMIFCSSVLTYTTTPNDLTDAIERLLMPLKYIGLGNAVHIMAMMMTIALRFIPLLIEETDKIMNAQKARGADMESGSILKRVKAMIPILIPLFLSAIRRATDLAEAMECRCYNGGVGRQRLKQMKVSLSDIISLILCTLLIAGIIFLNIMF